MDLTLSRLMYSDAINIKHLMFNIIRCRCPDFTHYAVLNQWAERWKDDKKCNANVFLELIWDHQFYFTSAEEVFVTPDHRDEGGCGNVLYFYYPQTCLRILPCCPRCTVAYQWWRLYSTPLVQYNTVQHTPHDLWTLINSISHILQLVSVHPMCWRW